MEHQMNGKDQAALTACIPQSLAGGVFIYKADEGETLLYASDYVIGFFGCASYEELADYVHHSFRGMVDLRDRELVETEYPPADGERRLPDQLCPLPRHRL